MKFIHTSDLHLGKRVNEFSLLEDQRWLLGKLLALTEQEKPDLFILAGDVYDKPIPPAEAVALFDAFVKGLADLGVTTAVIAGNHDSAERLSFGSSLMEGRGLYISPVYTGDLKHFTLEDAYGHYTVWLMPYLRPGLVRPFSEADITSYQDAVREALQKEVPDFTARNLLICHQFVTGASPSESEEFSVGGVDNIDAALLERFDYVALGHIHRPQQAGAAHIRYCGTPIKYAFSEALQEKSVTIGVLGAKGDLRLRTECIPPKRDMRVLTGPFSALMEMELTEDYVHICLTDEDELADGAARLRLKYPNLMRLSYDNSRTKAQGVTDYAVETKDPYTLFGEFYEAQNGIPLSDIQQAYIREKIREVDSL